MQTKLPPVHLLVIFESAARLGSFKNASEELFITPSAVSHQIKSLENHLGFPVFLRKRRGVKLNSAGAMYLHYIQKGIAAFEQGTKKVTQHYSAPTLKISCFSSFATNILIPQISEFQELYPDIDIRIETGSQMTDLRYDDVDVAIRIGAGDWPDLVTKKISDVFIAVVCSKAFKKKYNLNKPIDVVSIKCKVPLIDITAVSNVWPRWAKAVGVTGISTKRAITFNNYDASIRAAAQGLGLAQAMFPIEQSNEDLGLLVRPFSENIRFASSVYAVYREESADRHDIQCFIDWLTESPLLK